MLVVSFETNDVLKVFKIFYYGIYTGDREFGTGIQTPGHRWERILFTRFF
jgi:hypothetical protein